ncbi:MAG: flavodoxin family protein [Mucilaginibacter sp.]
MKALIINCTLKPSPEFSNTDALIKKAEQQLKENDVVTEVIRLVDYDIKPGTDTDMGKGDQWPLILEKIKNCNIFIIATPIWMGHLASTTQRMIERLDAIFHEDGFTDENNGQYFTYNKVGGCLVTGNEDGAHACAAQILWAMQELGFTIPPNVNAYWVGMAGGGEDYVEAGGEKFYYTNYTLRWMIANLAYFAKLLENNPITSNLIELKQKAKEESDRKPEKNG